MTRTTGTRSTQFGTILVAASGGMLLLGLAAASGCTQSERRVTASQAAVQASQVATTAVTTTVTGQNPTTGPRRNTSGIKFNGRGGYDSSEARAAALKRAHWFRDHHNEVFRPSWPKPPTSMPSN